MRAWPVWFDDVLSVTPGGDGQTLQLGGQDFVVRGGIPRSTALVSEAQAQTSDTFGFKWKKRDTFDSPASLGYMREWLASRYGRIESAPWFPEHGLMPLLLDAGCGAGMSGLEWLGPVLDRIRYVGVDVSQAVDVARQRFAERGHAAGFMQADISALPFAPGSVDLIFSEGVLHHTNSTERTLKSLAQLLKSGGRFLFYVYRRKGPIREFTDDYVRERLRALPAEAAWRAMEPLTQLGIALGELNAEIDIPEPIELLGIPAGRINVQRLVYWHVAKMYYRPDLTFDEMNHVNFDWYAPANASRHTADELRQWCDEAGMTVEQLAEEESGLTVIARKR